MRSFAWPQIAQRELERVAKRHARGSSGPDDGAVEHRDGPVRVLLGERRIVRDHDDGLAVALVELLQQRHDLARRAAVEIAGRLVGEQQVRLVRQRARDRDALLLAARELPRPMVLAAAEAHRLEQRRGARLALGARHAGEHHRQRDVLRRASSSRPG